VIGEFLVCAPNLILSRAADLDPAVGGESSRCCHGLLSRFLARTWRAERGRKKKGGGAERLTERGNE